MIKPSEVLERLYQEATSDIESIQLRDSKLLAAIEYVCRCQSNRAGVRLLMSCMLGKIDRPEVDPRRPYTEIDGDGTFSGRHYDETYVIGLINAHRLPCNSTTAFLTPALRNLNRPLSRELALVGRPARMYTDSLEILHAVATGKADAEAVLREVVRLLIVIREENEAKLEALLAAALS